MRCFVALDLPTPVRNHLVKVTAPLRERHQVKWVDREQMHLTLVFAGDLADDGVDALVDLVQTIELPPLTLHLDAFGWYPSHGMPRVLWVGIGGDVDPLSRLQAQLEHEAERFGVERDKRGFTPHVTVGRVKGPFGALALLDRLKEASAQLNQKPFSPPHLTLFRSQLTPGGPRYDPLCERVLTAGPG